MSIIIGLIPILNITNEKEPISPREIVLSHNQIVNSEFVESQINEFNNYELTVSKTNENVLNFNGGRIFDAAIFSEANFITCSESNVEVDFDIQFDKTTNEINGNIYYEQNELILNEEKVHFTNVLYNESTDSVLMFLEDGTFIDSADFIANDIVDNCVVMEMAVAAVSTVLVQAVVVVLVAVVIFCVIFWFFPWLKQAITLWQYQTTTVTTTKTITSPAIVLNGTRCETRAKSKDEVESLPRGDAKNAKYYLAFSAGISYKEGYTDTVLDSDGLYIGNEISFEEACVIMLNKDYTYTTVSDRYLNFVPSIYSYSQSDVMKVMDIVGYSLETPSLKPERTYPGFWHYHSACYIDVPVHKGTKKYRPHAFFSLLDFTPWLAYQ